MQLVDEEDAPLALLERVDDRLEALFEIAAEFGAREERAHVEREDARRCERLGHLLFVDAQRDAFDDGRLADARVADEERVVLAAAREDLDGALDLVLAADERIDVTLRRLFARDRRSRWRAGPCAAPPPRLPLRPLRARRPPAACRRLLARLLTPWEM